MVQTTKYVRKALQELGNDTPDQDIKNWIKANVPGSVGLTDNQVGLALRKLRGDVIPVTKRKPK